jgi:hypothetical protein
MAVPPTAWRNFIDSNTVFADGKPWPWQFGSNDAVPIDMADSLDPEESITNATATLRLIPHFEEADYTAADEGIEDVDVVGTVVLVTLTDLDQGRYYKLDVLIGPAGNRRGGNTIVHVSN